MQHTLCLTHVSSDVLMLRTSYSWSEVRNMDRLEDPPVPPELCRIDEVDRSVRTCKSPDGLCCCASLRVACHKFGRIGQTRAHANAKNGSIVLFAVLKTTQRTHTHKHINMHTHKHTTGTGAHRFKHSALDQLLRHRGRACHTSGQQAHQAVVCANG
jgi:hypothetical protein